MTIILVFPLPSTERKTMPPKEVPPWGTNQAGQMHHMERNRRIGAWRRFARDAALELIEEGLEVPIEPAFVRCSIPFWQKKEKRDPSNYTGTCHKAIVDGLVEAGLWPDDNPTWVTCIEPVLEVMPKDSRMVTVMIVPRSLGWQL